MKLKNVILLCVVLFIGLVNTSCKSNEKNQAFDYMLVCNDTIIIDFNDSIPDIDIAATWTLNSMYFSFITAADELVLYRYSFDTENWYKTCFSCMDSFFMKQYGSYGFINDSVVVVRHSYKNEIVLINLHSKSVIDKYKFSGDYNVSNIATLNMYYDSLVLRLPAMSLRKINDSYSKDAKLGMLIDTKTKDIAYFAKYPKHIKISEKSTLNIIIPNIIFQKEYCVMNFKKDKNIYIYSYEDKSYETILCADEGVNYNSNLLTGNEYVDALYEELNGLYKILLYDKKGHNYYRISVAYPKYNGEVPSSREGLYQILASRTLTITVLDKNFQIINKSVVSGVTDSHCFVKDGRLFLRNGNARKNERQLAFFGYELIKK